MLNYLSLYKYIFIVFALCFHFWNIFVGARVMIAFLFALLLCAVIILYFLKKAEEKFTQA